MQAKLDEILRGLPEKPPRSRLESYGAFIKELRRRKRTYREIAQILEEKCQLRVSKSTVHRFLQVRQRRRHQSPVATLKKMLPTGMNSPAMETSTQATDEIRSRLEELKQRPIISETLNKEFHYDRDEPLHLVPKVEPCESEDS